MALSPLRVPPGAITVVAGMMGLAAAWGLAWGQGLLSGLLIQATNVLDGADGETSRLHFRSSRRGALIDAAVDRIVDGSLVAGVGLWLWPFHPSLEFKVAILSSSAYGWGFIAYLFQSKLTGLEVSGADRPLVMLLGGRDSRLLILAVGTMLYQPGAAVAGGWIIYLSSVLRRVFLVRRGPRATPAVTTPPDEVGESPQRDLREER
jgi:phosphatidylglycerophosphate synthase